MPRPMPSLVFCACANLLAALVFTDPAMAQTGTLGTEYQATHYPSWQGASALSPYGVHNMHFALPVVRYLQEHEDQSLWLYECDKDSSESLGPILDWKSNRDSIMAAYDGSDVVAFIWRELNQLYVKVVDMGNGDVLLNTLYVSYWDSGGHHIVHTGSGNFMIVYGEGPSIDRSVLRARSLTWNGSAYVLGEAKTVDNVTGKPSAHPRLMRLSAGKTVCSYQKADGTPGNDPQAWDWDIKMRVLNADGSPSSAGEYSIAATTRREVQARIAGSYSTGHGLVVWEDVDGSGEYDIMRASFIANPSDGSISLPPEDWMESESNVKEWMPDVAYDHNARKYLVVYAREHSAGDNDILGKEVSLDGSTSSAQLICSSGANQLQPSVAYNGIHDEIGNTCVSFLVTWNDYRNGQECVYARSYSLPLPNRIIRFYSDGASEVPISVSPEDWNGDRNGTTPFSRLYLDGTTVSVSAPASIGGEAQDQWMYFSHWSDGYNDYSYRSFDFDVDGGDYTFTFYYLANRVPNKPTLSSPPNRATGQPLTPTLSASAFSDPDSGDSHSCSHWQVDNNSGFASPEWESDEDFDHRTQVAVPAGRLAHDTTYYWRVRYRDARMGWSEWSDAWWFKTDMSPLASIEITGPTEVNEGAGAQYACTAWYSDGSSADVTASTTWSEDSAYATISGGGYLSAGSVSADQSCRITASYGGKGDDHNITIKDTSPRLSVSPSSQTVEHVAGTTSFAITNLGRGMMVYQATETDIWLDVTSGAIGTNGGNVAISYEANSSTNARTGTVEIAAPGAVGSPQYVMVVQAGVPTLTIQPAGTNVSYGASGGHLVAVEANTPWKARTDSPWISITTGGTNWLNGSLAFQVESNNLAIARTGMIVVAWGELARTCTVTQAAAPPWLTILPASTNLPRAAVTGCPIVVSANVSWTASRGAGDVWISITGGGTNFGNGVLTFSVSTNAGIARAGTILVTGGGITSTCAVRQIGAPLVRHVWTNSPAPAAPFTNWTTAAHTIQDAVNACEDGDTVLVTNGIYQSGSTYGGVYDQYYGGMLCRVAINRPIHVRSVNGPEVTIIRGQGPTETTAIRCAYLVDGASLSGFTLSGGMTRASGSGHGSWFSGGGAYCEGNSSLSNCVVQGNVASDHGGGVCGGLIVNSTIANNSAGENGGGMVYSTVRSCLVASNQAGMYGGGIYGGGVDGCQVIGNVARYGGGGIHCTDGYVQNSLIASNQCTEYTVFNFGGGGVSLWGGVVSNCLIRGNKMLSGMSGGGVHGSYSSLVTHCEITENSAEHGGGAVVLDEGRLEHCELSRNWARSSGGGAYVAGTVKNCRIVQNVSSFYGGGASLSSGGLIDGCEIDANSVTSRWASGGGVYNYSDGTLRNSLLTRNQTTGYGGGIFLGVYNPPYPLVENCTIADNSAQAGAGIYSMGWAEVRNGIVYDNSPDAYRYQPGDGNIIFANTCLPAIPQVYGETCFLGPPKFLAREVGVYRLAGDSPCLNRGANRDWMGTSADLGGTARIVGGTVDAGAYEYGGSAVGYPGGHPLSLPGTVEMEDFNCGGPGLAYKDLTLANEGGQYRPRESVDISRDSGAGNRHAIGWTKAGEWLEYTVNVVSSGTYAAEVGVAAVGAGGQFRMLFNGIDKTGLMAVPNTGAWNAYQVVQKTGVALSSGIQTVRVEMVTTGASGNVGAFDWFRVGTFVPSLAINPASLELPKEASSGHQIAVVANVPWVATRGANSPWITISSGTNHGSGNVSFSISANNEAAGRQGNILVTGSGIVRTCMVTQVGTAVAYGGVVESIVAPSSLASGQMCVVTSTVRNTGTNRWTAAVAGSSAYPSYRVIFRNMSWTNSADQTVKQVMSHVEPGAAHALGSTVDVSRLPPGRYSYVVECKYHASVSSESYVTMGNSPRTNTLTIMAPPLPLPGTIEAEDFNYGEPGMAYSDATPLNEGGQYRPSEGVDISGVAGAGNGHVVGWTKAGEWLEYTVNMVSSGVYDLEARVAGVGTGGQFLIRFNGVDKTGALTVPNTGAWTTYQTVQKTNVSLSSGIQTVRVEMVATGTSGNVGAFDWFKVVVPPPGGQQPANAGYYPWPATDWVEFEDYDRGGEGVAYGDTTATNQGGAYRTGEGVDIAADAAASNGFTVGWTPAGEWLEYTALVPSNGMYDLEMRVANSGAGAICRIFVDGANVTGSLSIPNTGAWNAYLVARKAGLQLKAGAYVFRFEMDAASSAGFVGAFDRWRLVSAGPLFGFSQALAPSGTSRILGWDLYTNRVRIQHRPSLTTGEWAPVTGWITGQQYAVPASGMGTSGFYRIEYQP